MPAPTQPPRPATAPRPVPQHGTDAPETQATASQTSGPRRAFFRDCASL
ncbi:MAG: hypothetical protein ACU0CO_06660 [Shimia sp.]